MAEEINSISNFIDDQALIPLSLLQISNSISPNLSSTAESIDKGWTILL